MYTSRASFWLRSVLIASAVLVGLLTLCSTASAFGTVRLKKTTIPEADGRWKFDVDVDYGSKPHMGHIPFDFVFVQKVYFENSITDNDPKPVRRRKTMHNQQPQREKLDIGFADARGDLWQRTKFSFSLRRDRDFAAGEYTLTIKRSSDGATMGRPITITLDGENELIDRRAIVFQGKDDKKKDKKKKDVKEAAATDKPGGEPAAATPNTSNDGPSEPEPEEIDTSFADSPPPVDRKGTGCGCRMVESNTTHPAFPAGVFMLGLIGWARRRASAES